MYAWNRVDLCFPNLRMLKRLNQLFAAVIYWPLSGLSHGLLQNDISFNYTTVGTKVTDSFRYILKYVFTVNQFKLMEKRKVNFICCKARKTFWFDVCLKLLYVNSYVKMYCFKMYCFKIHKSSRRISLKNKLLSTSVKQPALLTSIIIFVLCIKSQYM